MAPYQALLHFIVTELRPIYAIQLALSCFIGQKIMLGRLLGFNKDEWQLMNSEYAKCVVNDAQAYLWSGSSAGCGDSGKNEACDKKFVTSGKCPLDASTADDVNLSGGYDVPDGGYIFNTILCIVSALVWAILVYKFCKEVGWKSELDGGYVKWCLRLEHGSFYRKLIYGWFAVDMISFIVAAAVYGMTFGEVAFMLLLLAGFRQMLTIDGKDTLIDMDCEGFNKVVFKFLPIFLWGCDATLDTAGEHKFRSVLDPAKYGPKLEELILSTTGDGLQLIQAGGGKAGVGATTVATIVAPVVPAPTDPTEVIVELQPTTSEPAADPTEGQANNETGV